MTMLSRVAERLYWMARYQERAEDTARLTNAYTHLVMDLPRGTEMGWDVLVKILGGDSVFTSRQRAYNEQNVLRFLIADTENPASIITSIVNARENTRTTRDVLPEETWEYTNELYLYAKEFAEKSVGRRNRYDFLDQVVTRCQQLNGFLLTTLSRDHAYRFIKVGRLLERADMSTRVIEVGSSSILAREASNPAIDPLLWNSLLQALSSIHSYREYTGPLVDPVAVVRFVFKENTHPRSVIFCLRGVRQELITLSKNSQAIGAVDDAIASVTGFSVKESTLDQLHEFIDELQHLLGIIHTQISASWFGHS